MLRVVSQMLADYNVKSMFSFPITFRYMQYLYFMTMYNKHNIINVIVCTTISCRITYKNCKQNDCQFFTADTTI